MLDGYIWLVVCIIGIISLITVMVIYHRCENYPPPSSIINISITFDQAFNKATIIKGNEYMISEPKEVTYNANAYAFLDEYLVKHCGLHLDHHEAWVDEYASMVFSRKDFTSFIRVDIILAVRLTVKFT